MAKKGIAKRAAEELKAAGVDGMLLRDLAEKMHEAPSIVYSALGLARNAPVAEAEVLGRKTGKPVKLVKLYYCSRELYENYNKKRGKRK